MEYCSMDIQSCNPIVLMSTPSMKIFPEVASKMRNSARSSCRIRVRRSDEPTAGKQTHRRLSSTCPSNDPNLLLWFLIEGTSERKRDTPRKGYIRSSAKYPSTLGPIWVGISSNTHCTLRGYLNPAHQQDMTYRNFTSPAPGQPAGGLLSNSSRGASEGSSLV